MFTEKDKIDINNKISIMKEKSNELMKLIGEFSFALEKDDNYQKFVNSTEIGIRTNNYYNEEIKNIENLYEDNKKVIYNINNLIDHQINTDTFKISL